MNEIKEYLESKSINISLDPSERSFFTAWEIKAIIDAPYAIEEMCRLFPLKKIDSLEEFYLFFLFRKIITYNNSLSSLVHENHKEIIMNVIKSAKDQLSNIDVGSVIRFINGNFEEIFSIDNDIGLTHVTIDYIVSYISGITEDVLEYLADKHGYLLLNRYDKFEKVIEHNPGLFELIFKTGTLTEVDSLRLDTVLDVWTHIYGKSKSNLKVIVDRLLLVLYSDMSKLSETATIDNVMIIERTISIFYSFLKKIKNPRANEFAHIHKRIETLLDQYLTEKGHVFKYELPVKEMVNKWKSIERWESRLLCLTHDRKATDNLEMVSRMSTDFVIKSSFLDLVSTNVPTDEYFKLSRQQGLSLLSNIQGAMLIGIMSNTETQQDLLSQIASAIYYISQKFEEGDENLNQDAKYLIDQIRAIADNVQNNDTVRILCYGASMFAISLAEKLLRMTYISIVKDRIYVPVNKATLGDLLNDSNMTIVDIFGDIHVKCLSYFLIQTPDSKIGYSLRNSLAHWNDISPQSMNIRFFSICLWLFIDIMNTIFWHFSKQEDNL